MLSLQKVQSWYKLSKNLICLGKSHTEIRTKIDRYTAKLWIRHMSQIQQPNIGKYYNHGKGFMTAKLSIYNIYIHINTYR